MQRTASIVVAAGKGTRMRAKQKKQYLKLQGIPLLIHTLNIFENSSFVSEIVLVVPKDDIDFCTCLLKKYKFTKISNIVAGGKTRGESVFNGLKYVSKKNEMVAVHDGVRPLLNVSVLEKTIEAAIKYDAAVAAVKVKDTIKVAGELDFIKETLPRDKLWSIQTPQVFKRDLLYKCYQEIFSKGLSKTDDAAVVECCGYKVKLVEGSYENIKVTTPEDLYIAEAILKERV